ncbi:NAD(P)/FAD-dependent oxidoreductase [Zunongwangia sp. F363]|uniref:NAD(P)/FAD-dependent oxidoreductase n=1 Tax=Autumnicola tepida TaxID=3075595 RepID=A0ABU3CBX1_9FLAO|nr:NAD(P)/FAD-dependent oxidoreductase [Zunongwangia sp. F363]MDT0643768.1 NAD(P)/FAD-dependent oxidoreductase [Zunongwangia sp. F363]
MEKKDYKINIVGDGLSGLTAARVLESHGYRPKVYEALDCVGGRLKTDIIEGYQLDRGFQVLLSAYPKLKEYARMEDLDLQQLKPGAVIFSEGKSQRIGDPFRDPSALLPTVFSSIGNLADKWKIIKLNLELRKKSPEEIFSGRETTTLQYLNEKGFSEKMINSFFRPFFGGIFLENELRTSSYMFEFIYKMFGEGRAVIPKSGIEALPAQMAKGLVNTTFYFNTPVKQVSNEGLILSNNKRLASHFTIIATEAEELIKNLRGQQVKWKSCYNFYFTTKQKKIEDAVIGLIADEEALINNIFYPTSIATASSGSQQLLSVTVIKETALPVEELKQKIIDELRKHCGIEVEKFLKYYHIKKALPDLSQAHYEIDPTETKLSTQIFLAGDQLLNASQNAAILSGERAALGVIQTLESGAITSEITSEYS